MKEKLIKLIAFILVLLSLAIQIFAQSKTLDDFNSIDGWKIVKSDGVEIKISSSTGINGKCIKIDYNFTKGSGYGGIQKIIPIEYPNNFQFSFYLKGNSPNNNLEFKLVDESGDNVWWFNNRNYEFPNQWKKYVIKKRKIEFAWGPTSDKSLRKTNRLEFIISSFNGGKGTIYIDELKFEEKQNSSNDLNEISINASSNNNEAKNLIDKNRQSVWTSDKNKNQELIFDLNGNKEFGGLKINWSKESYAKKFQIFISDDKKEWSEVYSANKNNSNTSFIRIPECESKFVKILFTTEKNKKLSIGETSFLPADYSADMNRFLINVAKEFPRGFFPRYFNEEKSYWTIVGEAYDYKEALINEDGMVEVDKQNFSVEPFIYVDGKLQTWNDQKNIQSLEDNYLPIPRVVRLGSIQLEVKSFANGEPNKSTKLYLIYTLKNITSQKQVGNFYLALRSFQVNPYYQWLNTVGGFAKVKTIDINQSGLIINKEKFVLPITKPNEISATSFDDGEIINYISKDQMPKSKNIIDENGLASAAIKYSFELNPDEEKKIYITIPFYNNSKNEKLTPKIIDSKLEQTKKFWIEKTNHVKFNLPQSADKLINIVRSNLAYILINRDNYGIQPGSRSYERSWIRDGALTSSALLKNGLQKEVKEFADWYSNYIFENGKVPCVVDRRGPDPVPENDSHGEFIFLIKQYFNYSKDTLWLKEKYPKVLQVVDYLSELINQRTTEYYKNGNDSLISLYGLLPESISHEGYSDKPRHTYWDDFWAMKGLKDAYEIALLIGNEDQIRKIKKMRDEFKVNLYNSIQLSTKLHKINYIPGCAELGDFDATSTTIALYPCNEKNNLPKDLLENTFSKYWEFTQNRSLPSTNWEAYTPYEVRTIGSFVFLNQPEKAHWLINYFMNDQRPQGWNHWAEVVWKDKRLPRFIGDMPHTWVGSDFINSFRSLLVYENDFDSSLVVGAGLYQDWIDNPDGISIENLPTYFGELSYSIKKESNFYKVNLYGDVKMPSGGIVLQNFNSKKLPVNVIVNDKEIKDFTNEKILIKEIPAELKIIYNQ